MDAMKGLDYVRGCDGRVADDHHGNTAERIKGRQSPRESRDDVEDDDGARASDDEKIRTVRTRRTWYRAAVTKQEQLPRSQSHGVEVWKHRGLDIHCSCS